ncbi:MAG: hypothetical protein M3R26_01330 [Actinomycetota bacterium]|nr:hypothetical protein [Actinomycetota bacterium]MDQ2980954.1 hypothetical protein [Actinomycetota bacterium]
MPLDRKPTVSLEKLFKRISAALGVATLIGGVIVLLAVLIQARGAPAEPSVPPPP